MRVWICDECGREIDLGSEPERCECKAVGTYIKVDKVDASGFGCNGPGF